MQNLSTETRRSPFPPALPLPVASTRPSEATSPPSLDDFADELGALAKEGSVEQAVAAGRMVIERLYDGELSAWRGRGSKAHSLRTLARRADLAVSSSALYRAIALYELSEGLGGLERWCEGGLGISHVRLVLGLPKDEQRRLLDEAMAASWTVAELEREATRVRDRAPRKRRRGGRPRLPRFVKSLNRLRKYTTDAPEELFGDIEAAADMPAERVAELRSQLAEIRSQCEELDRALASASANASLGA